MRGTLASVAMVLITTATGLYVIALVSGAPGLAGEANGPLGAPIVAVSIGIQLGVMLAAARLATVSTRRGGDLHEPPA